MSEAFKLFEDNSLCTGRRIRTVLKSKWPQHAFLLSNIKVLLLESSPNFAWWSLVNYTNDIIAEHELEIISR